MADGMGGHRGGATASRMCIEAAGRVFCESGAKPEECLRESLLTANSELRQASELDPELRGMGTTAVAILFEANGDAFIAWIGDSRAYLLRGGELRPLTEDHSLVAMWVREGILTPEQAEEHPRRNELIRAIGVVDEIEVDIVQYEPQRGDRLVLCSDGLCGAVSPEVIQAGLETAEPEEAARVLVASANDAGGSDNITVQVIAVPDAGGNRDEGRKVLTFVLLGILVVITALGVMSLMR